MISVVRISSPAYAIVTPSEPFAFQDLAERGVQDAKILGDAAVFGTPLLIDFRQVNLLRFSADDFQKVISRRYRADKMFRNVPCAFVAANETNFGMLRMYDAYAEARQLRKDEATFLTTDFDAAKIWISRAASHWHGTQSVRSKPANPALES